MTNRQIPTEGKAKEVAMEALIGAMERHGIKVDDLGPEFQRAFTKQRLDDQATQFVQDFALLTTGDGRRGGHPESLVLERMAPSVNLYIRSAILSETPILQALRPIIDKMLEKHLFAWPTKETGA